MCSSDLKNATFRASVPILVHEHCDTAWDLEEDRDLCYRVNAAVKSMTETMAGILGKPAPDFATPDTTLVPKTIDAHPPVQCRMDTVFQASLCAEDFGADIIPGKNVRDGVNSEEAERESARRTCTALSNHVIGLRPRCWFKPRI